MSLRLSTVHYQNGRLLAKSNPYFNRVWQYIKAIHVAHSAEQLAQLFWHLKSVFQEWEENGDHQPKSKWTHTTVGFWKQYCLPPWNTWSIGTFDGFGMLPECTPRDLPGCLPSNQCQESWHKMLKRTCKGMLRGSLHVSSTK